MLASEREDMIRRYGEGAGRLRQAWERVPAGARKWRPGKDRWSAHEVVLHAADSETNGAMRLRYVLAEKDPVIQGYDEAEWARRFDYHELPVEPALDAVAAVRSNTFALLTRLTDDDWKKTAKHSDSGPYAAESWLRVYAEHLEKHCGQIERNLAAWEASRV